MTTPTIRNSPPTPHSCRAPRRPHPSGAARRPRTPAFIRGCLPAAASLCLACGPGADPRDAAGPVVETETIGDTTVVRTVSGSVWGGDATLVPETSIGELDGPDEYLFGSVRSIAVDDDRNVYVLDGQARHVRAYDADGNYLRTLGRDGEGPGEFKVPIGLAISNGRLLVRDPANGRVQLFVLETGENQEWRYLPSEYFMNTPLYRDDHGRVYVDISDPEVHFIVMDDDGAPLDTISAPAAPADFDDDEYSMSTVAESGDRWMSVGATVPFGPDWHWTIHPSGHFLAALSTAYRINLEQDDGVLRIERDHTPVAVSDDERARHEERIMDRMRQVNAGWSWDGPPIPDRKPPFRGLAAGSDGRIWVRLWTEARQVPNDEHDPADPESAAFTWVEPLRYDVFEADGTYLGAVSAPDGFSLAAPPVFGRSFVWAVERDDLGVQRVVRYRIALPAPGLRP